LLDSLLQESLNLIVKLEKLLNISLSFLPPTPYMEELNLKKLSVEDSAGLCSSWILKQRMPPSVSPLPGTTFPPLAQTLPYLKARLASSNLTRPRSCRCLSEPDLSLSQSMDEEEKEGKTSCSLHDRNEEDCEDFLFEFDIGSPVTSEDEDEMNFSRNIVLNQVEEYEEAVIESVIGKRWSYSSDSSNDDSSSGSVCDYKENCEMTDRDGFGTIFGSISSGLGRSIKDISMDDSGLEPEGLDIEPRDWKDNYASLYLRDKSSSTGSSTPILAASPAVDTPILSPDSCLDEENLVEDQSMCVVCQAKADIELEPKEEFRDVTNDASIPELEELMSTNRGENWAAVKAHSGEGILECEETGDSNESFEVEMDITEESLKGERVDSEGGNNKECSETLKGDSEECLERKKDCDDRTSFGDGVSENDCSESTSQSGVQPQCMKVLLTDNSSDSIQLNTVTLNSEIENRSKEPNVPEIQNTDIDSKSREPEINADHKPVTPPSEDIKLQVPPIYVEDSSQDKKIEICSNLKVSEDKLKTLLSRLEPDKSCTEDDLRESSHMSQSSQITVKSSSPVSSIEREDRPKLRKCSSLRSMKTPPQTPGTSKIVRFADILGLDLSQVKVFLDEIPKVPKSAFEDLDIDHSLYPQPSPLPVRRSTSVPAIKTPQIPPVLPSVVAAPSTSFVPMFDQPGGSPSFFTKIHSQKVCLENAYMDGQEEVSGIVRVLNISFNKSVIVRWTVNDWSLVTEQQAYYVPGSSHANTDKFSFKMKVGRCPVGTRLQFCLKYSCMGEHWDSNGGENYVFQTLLSNSKLLDM